MATLASVLADIATLTASDKEILKRRIIKAFSKHSSSLETFIKDKRFSGGLVCPICGCIHVVRNGHRKDGVQRYVCRNCGKSFVAASNSIVSSTKKDFPVWEQYIDCMINGFSLRKSANICGIHRNTAFIWRHKILGALQNMADSVVLDGIIEADETFFSDSYKGNHKRGAFIMPRKARKRGKSVHKRGLSHEKVCVPCAVNRKGLSIAKAINLGRVATKDLHSIYDNRIEPNSVIVTDLMNSYRRFATKNGLELVQLKGSKSKKGIYNIQHINSYHSELKRFIDRFKGVSTKHLNNYLIWHNFVNYATKSEVDKRSILLKFVVSQAMVIHAADVSKKPTMPFAA